MSNVVTRLNASDKAAVSQSLKQARLVDASRKLARIVKHTDPDAKAKAARTRLEKSLTKWIKHHGGEAFDSPFSRDHKKVLAKIETAINKGGMFALAMPRGGGKSTILKWATLYCILTGRRKYVVVVAATAEFAQAIVDFVRQQIQESDTLHTHYPHVTTYARATDGKAIKARYQLRADGKTSGIRWSKTALVLPEVLDCNGKPYQSNGGIIEGHGLTGAIKGRWRDTKTGKVLRPDFVLLDDPQTRESAESESQCNMRERVIAGDVLGLAGPRKKIAAIMTITVIKPGDLAARFLDHAKHPEWSGETCKLVDKWPEEQDGLWEEYAQLYRDGIADGSGTGVAFAFYRKNRAAMDKGAKVSWKHRVRNGEISALQTAENLLIETGEQFWAEYQNEPKAHDAGAYEVTPEIILSRESGYKRLQAPEGGVLCCGIDINYVGMNWAVVHGDAVGRSRKVIAHGKWPVGKAMVPKGVTVDQACTLIRRGIGQFTAEVLLKLAITSGASARRIDCATYDLSMGAWQDAGMAAIKTLRVPFPVYGLKAFGAKQYRPQRADLRAGKGWRLTDWPRLGRVLVINSDYWREIMQRGFLVDPAEPGAIALYAPDKTGNNAELAAQIAGEKITGQLTMQAPIQGTFQVFGRTPGIPNDRADALVYGCALTGVMGIGEDVAKRPARKRQRTGVSVIPI
jgi:hypothetical protein